MTALAPAVLIVEDEPKLAALIDDYLRSGGYRTKHASDGVAALDAVRAGDVSLILLDLVLPRKDGLAVCREVRSWSDIPIVMVTARVDEIDRLLGLELGADDYVCKPFSPRELVARVNAVLRRAPPDAAVRLAIDAERMEASFDGRVLDLTLVEFRLLATLAARPGRIYSRDALLDGLYDDERVVLDRTVDSHVKNLRRKLANAGAGDELIRSIYGVGYKLELR